MDHGPCATPYCCDCFWEYREASAAYFFGETLRGPVADEILQTLRQSTSGMTRTELRGLFRNHSHRDQLDLALAVLSEDAGETITAETDTPRQPVLDMLDANPEIN
jgi:hypothetical protein